jgi:hypothetical protein
MTQRRPVTAFHQTPFLASVGKPPLSWAKGYAREYRRTHPGASLHEAAAAGLADAYQVLIDHVRESQR